MFRTERGTAINLFVRDLPRLSVDIDLAYLPNSARQQALADVRQALERIAGAIARALLRASRPFKQIETMSFGFL